MQQLITLTTADLINIDRDLSRLSLSEYIKMAWPVLEPGQPYIHGWHIDAIAEHLEAVTDNEISRLLINVPPGMMKSMATSVFWPSWEWGARDMPHNRFIAASHSQSLAIRDNVKTRRLISSQWYQERWTIELAADQNAKTKFENSATGFREACAAGSITGSRGDRVIVDDPHTIEGAMSALKRQTTLDWFCHTLPTRLNNPATSAIVTIMQRIHEDDISGYILAKELGYEHLCLPMEFEKARKCYTCIGFEDPRKTEGELLFPQRFPREVVERDKKVMGSMAVAGQFQQSPAPAGGSIFQEEWFRYYSTPRRYKRIIMSVDTAYKPGALNDPTVCGIWGEHEVGYDLLHVYRERVAYPQLKRDITRLADEWIVKKHLFAAHILFTILIEDKASGQSLIQDMRNDTKYNIVAIEPEGDKLTRAAVCAPQFEAGKVFLLKDASWLEDYKSELLIFPNSTHDDQVDMTSQFLNSIATPLSGTITDSFLEVEEFTPPNNPW